MISQWDWLTDAQLAAALLNHGWHPSFTHASNRSIFSCDQGQSPFGGGGGMTEPPNSTNSIGDLLGPRFDVSKAAEVEELGHAPDILVREERIDVFSVTDHGHSPPAQSRGCGLESSS
ncbi:hypothetical protein [Bradyrhizobium sp. Leo121]|uniref:hypothetical protein n=1 Tax=Bradyrhizobium sp. Leo121 TaxID=1571195 RepID=UPI001029EAD7|nr:hypothetical protein [Bradyrhizobium sp. Leo121]